MRAWCLTQRGSLWLDEASLALNVLGRDFATLAAPLDWGQAAPVGFLWILKALTLALGPAEWVLRLWPFVAGASVLPLTWVVGRRIVGEGGALLATVSLAASLLAIRYSAEAKPYASDAGIALLLVWLALRVLDAPAEKKRWATLQVTGVAAVLLSLPSAFVLGAIGITMFLQTRKDGRAALLRVAAGAGAWLATFAIMWVVVVRESSGGAYLREYWAPVMLDVSAPNFLARAIRMLASVSSTPLRWDGALWPAVAAMVATLCGLFAIARKNRAAGILLGGPAALGAFASLLGVYPMSDRLAFFAAPLMILAAAKCAAGLVGLLSSRAGPRPRSAIVSLVAMLVAVWIGSDSRRLVRNPGALEATREIFEPVRADALRAGIPVYVFARAAPAWLYETMDWRNIDMARYEFYRSTTGDVARGAHENFSRPLPVVVGEGTPMTVPGANPAELIGLATGVRYRVVGATSREGITPGWAAEEARRIAVAANPSVWIVASHFFEGTLRDELMPLVEAVRSAGLEVVEERRGGRDVIALRVERPAKR